MAKPTKNTKPAKSAKPSNDEFISEESLGSGESSYMKLEKGVNQFRVISKPVTGWIDWVDDGDKRKPMRTPLSDGEPEVSNDDNKPKKFVTFAVIDKKDGLVKILELTQQSVIKAIRALTNHADWGQPFSYDLNIEKSGDGLKTKYAVQPSPKKPLSKDMIQAAGEKPCNLEALFSGENPWEVEDEVTEYFFK